MLLDEQKESFHKMVKISGSGAFGGDEPTWADGEQFQGIAIKQSTTQMRIAQKEYAIGNYLITSMSNIALNKGDFIRRDSDNFVLKITDNNNNSAPPNTSMIDIKSQAFAEESSLI